MQTTFSRKRLICIRGRGALIFKDLKPSGGILIGSRIFVFRQFSKYGTNALLRSSVNTLFFGVLTVARRILILKSESPPSTVMQAHATREAEGIVVGAEDFS